MRGKDLRLGDTADRNVQLAAALQPGDLSVSMPLQMHVTLDVIPSWHGYLPNASPGVKTTYVSVP